MKILDEKLLSHKNANQGCDYGISPPTSCVGIARDNECVNEEFAFLTKDIALSDFIHVCLNVRRSQVELYLQFEVRTPGSEARLSQQPRSAIGRNECARHTRMCRVHCR